MEKYMSSTGTLNRRRFLQSSAAMAGAGLLGNRASAPAHPVHAGPRLPREVWIASIPLNKLMDERRSGPKEKFVSRVIQRMEETLPYHPDIFCLTETLTSCPAPLFETAETLSGPVVSAFADFARTNNCYVICPLYVKKYDLVWNTGILLDRQGDIVFQYDKIHPTESEIEKGVTPGPYPPPVYKTDFGTIGIQICFDANWYADWSMLKESGAEIIFFPSDFNAATILNHLAFLNEFYIVSCIKNWHPSRIIDITGEDMYNSEGHRPWLCSPVNLDKAVFHLDYQQQKLKDLRAKYGRALKVRMYGAEGRFTIESLSPDLTVQDIIKEFELVTYRDYIKRATINQDKARTT